jgi:hypothetical protein
MNASKDRTIALADAERFIAETVYAPEYRSGKAGRRNALKRVRSRVAYAYKTGVFGGSAKKPPPRVDYVAFFCWACEQKGWAGLKQLDVPQTRALTWGADAVLTYADADIPESYSYEELKEHLREALRYQREIKPDLEELADYRARTARKEAEGRRYGKEGGRGKEK